MVPAAIGEGQWLSPEKMPKLVPGQAVKDVRSLKPGSPRLIEAASNKI
jgi:hypothetical protein